MFNVKSMKLFSDGFQGEVNDHTVAIRFSSWAWSYPISVRIDNFPNVWVDEGVASKIISRIDDPLLHFILELSDQVTWKTRSNWVDRYLKEKDVAKMLDKTLLGIQISVGLHRMYPDYALFKVQYFKKTLEKYSRYLPAETVEKWKRALEELENKILAASLSR